MDELEAPKSGRPRKNPKAAREVHSYSVDALTHRLLGDLAKLLGKAKGEVLDDLVAREARKFRKKTPS